MLLQELGDSLGVAHVALHAQAERLDALQEQPGVERRLAGADIAQDLDAGFGDESGFTQVSILDAVVAGIGRGEIFEATAACPIEIAAIDDDPADRGAVTAEELGGGMGDDIGTPFERPAQVRSGKGVVYHQREI